jgi:hypothetical protein
VAISDYIAQVADSAPDLLQYPDLALAAAQSGTPGQTAQVLAQTSRAAASEQALAKHEEHHGFWGSILHEAKALGGTVLDYAGKPLHEIQHDYRFVHDLWVKSDPISATLATLGVFGGAAAGAAFGGPQGAFLGADAALYTEGQLASHGVLDPISTSYKKIYDDSDKSVVSPGRDFAHLVGLHNTDSGWGKFASGLTDGAFDFGFDPLNAGLGLLAKARKSQEGLTATYAARNVPAVQKFLMERGFAGVGTGDIVDGAGRVTVDAVDRIAAARNNPLYERSINEIARTVKDKGVGGFISQFPQYARMAPVLAGADTADKVHDVFLGMANSSSLQHGYSLLPTRTVLHAVSSRGVQRLKEVGGTASGDAAEGNILQTLNPTNAASVAGYVSRKTRTFSGYLPYAIDRSTKEGKELLDLSGKHFDLNDPGALQGIYRSFRFSMGEKAAQIAVGDIALAQASGDLRTVRQMYMGGQKQMLVAAGLSDSHPLVQQVMDRLEMMNTPGRSEIYGHGFSGGDAVNHVQIEVPALVTDASESATTMRSQPMALWEHQATEVASFPNFWQVKNAVRAMDKVSNAIGSADEFFVKGYTDRIFKPLALVNMGFGIRVAMAEALPATFRYGALNMLQNRVNASAAKSGYKIEQAQIRLVEDANKAAAAGDMEKFTELTKKAQDGEVGHILSVLAKLHGGSSKLLKISDQDIDIATRMVTDFNGQIVTGVSRAGEATHLAPSAAVDREYTNLWYTGNAKIGLKKTGNFSLFDKSTDSFADEWHGYLTRMKGDQSAKRIAADLLEGNRNGLSQEAAANRAIIREQHRIAGRAEDGSPLNGPDPYENQRKRITRFGKQDPMEFAGARVDALRNVVTGTDGTLHTDLLEALSKNRDISRQMVASKTLDSAPAHVPGMVTAPVLPLSPYTTLINKGFKHLVDPVINYISREPLFLAAVKEQLPALRSMVNRNIISEDQMYREAYYRATEAMLPQIHNVMLRSQFSAVMRNVMPFYFAQEQAIKRVGHLAGKDPAALRKYQMIEHALSDPNFVHADANGNRSLVIPLAGGIGTHVLDGLAGIGLPVQAGLPLTFTGSLTSLKTVLPEAAKPGTSPLVSIPLNALANLFPEWTPQVKAVIGEQSFGQSLKNQFIPNQLVKATLAAMTGDQQDKTMANATISALTAAAAHGQLPDPNAGPAEQQAALDRIKNNARSIVFMKGLLATFSPLAPTPHAEDFGLREDFQNLLDSGKTYPEAVQEFIAKHGNKAISYTVGKSDNETGAILPTTTEALKFIQDHRDLIKDNISAAYFVPEKGHETDSFEVYNEALNMGLRQRETPEDFREQMYIKAGTQEYQQARKAHEAQLATLTDPDQIKQETANFNAYVEDLKKSNVLWAADFTSDTRNLRAINLFQNMQQLFSKGEAPASEQTDKIASLMQDAERHLAALSTSQNKTVARDNWGAYLDTVEAANPELSNVISNVFRRIDRRV